MFRMGDRVKILNPANYSEISAGDYGVVQSVYGTNPYHVTNVGVEIYGKSNPRASKGLFYFKSHQLMKVDEDTNEQLKKKEGAFMLEGNYRVVVVNNVNNSEASYACACFDDTVAQGDRCIIAVEHKYYVGEVCLIMETVPATVRGEVVCKVDFTPFEMRVSLRKKASKLMDEMATRAASLQQIAIYKMLAEQDPQMNEFLSKFLEIEKALNN